MSFWCGFFFAALQNKLLLVRSLRIHIEIVQTTKYQSFLDTFFPVFEKFLTHTTTPQPEDNEEQKLRYEVLDILSRLPTNGVMVAYAARLCKLVVFCLSQENEKNGLVCLRILHNLHQHLRPQIQHETQAFVIFIHKVGYCVCDSEFPLLKVGYVFIWGCDTLGHRKGGRVYSCNL